MSSPFREHPLRHSVSAELHARTFDPLRAPARMFHITSVCGEHGGAESARHLLRLLDHYGAPHPETIGQYYAVDLGDLRLRWERHTEFVTYTFSRHESFSHPFTDPLSNALPQQWLSELPGEVITATLLAIESCEMPERGQSELCALFGGNPYIGCEVVNGGASAWSDLRIHPDGYSRFLLRECGLSENQAGRLAKRLLEVNAYRAMALLGLSAAREANKALSDAEQHLVSLASRIAELEEQDDAPESELLSELTTLAAEIETIAARTVYRFEASRAYYQIVRQRLERLRQRRIEGLQTFTEFLDARLAPAVATCESARQRQQDLAERAARLTSLLRARVEVELQAQNRGLLESMDQRAKLQLRLQETVEGLSVIAIGYYGVGLVGYALKGLQAQGLPINVSLGMGIAVPVVVGFAWLGLKRMKKRLFNDH